MWDFGGVLCRLRKLAADDKTTTRNLQVFGKTPKTFAASLNFGLNTKSGLKAPLHLEFGTNRQRNSNRLLSTITTSLVGSHEVKLALLCRWRPTTPAN